MKILVNNMEAAQSIPPLKNYPTRHNYEVICVNDAPRENALQAVRRLKRMGIKKIKVNN